MKSEVPMDLPEFLRRDALGEVFFVGHRVTLYHAMKSYLEDSRPETIVEHFPTLTLPLAYKAVAFYLENREAVDQYMEETRREIQRQAELPQRGPSMGELKQRLEAQRQAESA